MFEFAPPPAGELSRIVHILGRQFLGNGHMRMVRIWLLERHAAGVESRMHALQFRESVLYRSVDHVRALKDFDFAQLDFEWRKLLETYPELFHRFSHGLTSRFPWEYNERTRRKDRYVRLGSRFRGEIVTDLIQQFGQLAGEIRDQ